MQLSKDESAILTRVVGSFLDFYYKPLVFPDEYFPHYKSSMRYRLIKPRLPLLYNNMKESVISTCLNENTYNAWKELKEKPSKATAQCFFEQVWYFLDYASANGEAVKKLMENAQLPMAGRLAVVLNEMTTKEMKGKMGLMRVFLVDLVGKDYLNWLDSVKE